MSDLEQKINQLYELITAGKGTDSDISKKMSKIIVYVIKQKKKSEHDEKALSRAQQRIDGLIAENERIKKENQKLVKLIEAERATSNQYSHNLWEILEKLAESETCICFTKH